MACGVPVITSNTTSLPEVVGNAAMMVPPEDITALSQAMAQVLKNPEVQRDMRARGLRRARHFSWTQTAARLLEIYQAVHAESQSR
jgi:glycosyltransferase involved in cell wall biosynthesis